jgi:thiamine-monophosphate kinase
VNLTVGELGERGLVRLLAGELNLDLVGDDSALLPGMPAPAATVDSFFQGVHFQTWWCPPEILGRRLLEATLSDLAAVGADPLWLLAAVSLPPDTRVEWLLGFYRGLTGRSDCVLAGGETVRGDVLGVTLTALGNLPGKPLLRSAARPGDRLWVTGPLGRTLDSPALLEESRMRPLAPEEQRQVARFLEPRARFDASGMLRKAGCRCAIDISDGLATEAAHISRESCVRTVIHVPAVPLVEYAEGRPLEAFRAGEDYELLFAAPAEMSFPGCHPVGRVERGEGVCFMNSDGSIALAGEGYDHFRG